MKLTLKKKNKSVEKKSETLTEKEKYAQLEKVAMRIEKMRLGDYINNMNRPSKIIMNNLLGGISRGVGLTVGATLVIALLFKLLSILISMNIPYLTEVLQDIVSEIRSAPMAQQFTPQTCNCDTVIKPEESKIEG